MIWLISLFTIVTWFTPMLSVMPSAYAFSMENTKLKYPRLGLIVLYYVVMAIQSVAWCGVLGSIIMNLVCMISYLVPIIFLQKCKFNTMWKLFITEIIYFVVTNFYSWIVMPEYTKDIAGIISCYVMALPFFGRSLISCFGFYSLFTELQKIRIKKYGMSVSC